MMSDTEIFYTIGPKALFDEIIKRGGVLDKARGGVVYSHLEFAQMALIECQRVVRVPVYGVADTPFMTAAIYGVEVKDGNKVVCLRGCDEMRLEKRAKIIHLPEGETA